MTTLSANLRRFSTLIALMALATAVTSATSCSKKTKPDESLSAASDLDNAMGDSDSGKAMGLQTIHFPYDSFTLDSAAKETLKANADLLKASASVKIQVEGHCDQRGGIQYNIALGEKRANAVKKYLADMGVAGDRVTTISFGKERPMDSAESEAAYAKNRRANFVITTK